MGYFLGVGEVCSCHGERSKEPITLINYTDGISMMVLLLVDEEV